jgi:predicted flap endonuclease-1-like 5' DNA nuclease
MLYFFRKAWLWIVLAMLISWLISWLWHRRRTSALGAQGVAAESSALKEHKAKINELTKLRAVDQEHIADLKAKLADHQEHVAEHASKIEGMSGELAGHQAHVADLDAKHAEAQAELTRITALLAGHEANADVYASDHAAHAAALADLSAEAETHKAAAAEHAANLAAASSELEAYQARIAQLEADLAACQQSKATTAAPMLDLAAAKATLGTNVKMDDLEVVEGIGPKIAELLRGNGIATWAQLASSDPAQLRTILDAGGSQYRIADPQSWPEQARLLNGGQWSEFKTLTDQLDAGRYAGGTGTGAAHLAAAPPVPTAEQLAAGGAVLGTKLSLDDLKVVEGIGPAISQLLIDGGVTTWRGLEAAPVARLREILDGGGSRFQMHDPTTWPQQAGLLADAKWAEFKQLTDELDAGRSS